MTLDKKNPAVTVRSYELPKSVFVDDQSIEKCELFLEFFATLIGSDDITAETSVQDMLVIRERLAQAFYQSSVYADLCRRYPCTHQVEKIAGVTVEIFKPDVSHGQEVKDKVLINFHGGGFEMGARTVGHLESRPIVSLAGITVISVDYGMWPEYRHPAALNDAIAVYTELLKQYRPDNMGVYGCSAGAVLTSQLIAYLIKEKLPLPKAAGMFCASPKGWMRGDSGAFVAAMTPPDRMAASESQMRYFKDADCEHFPMLPGEEADIMRCFPPSLLISSMRDFAVSAVVATHRQLVSLGVEADLHIWDGLDHAFMLAPDMSEAQQAAKVIVGFFKKHLNL